MPQITIKAKGIELVRKGLEDFAADIPRVSKGRIYGRMDAARKRISKYPPIYRGRMPGGFKSDKQRRYVMMLVRQGKVPYQRTGAYMDTWEIVTLPNDRGYRLQTRGKADKYAKWVGGDARGRNQARIHQGRWAVARTVIDEEVAKIPQEIDRELSSRARRRGL